VSDSAKSKDVPKDSERTTILGAVLFLAGKRLLLGLVTIITIIFLSYLGLDVARGTDCQSAVIMEATSTRIYLSRLMTGDLG
jgi:hypothetical protein